MPASERTTRPGDVESITTARSWRGVAPRLEAVSAPRSPAPASAIASATVRGTCRARDVAPDGAQTVNVDLDADWLATLAATTATTYRAAVARFAGWLGCAPGDVPRVLFDAGRGDAARLARRYRAALLAERLAPATINVRLAALRSLVAVGRAIGLIEWGLEVPAVRAVTYRDTRGPGLAGARAMLAATAASRGIARQCRDSLLIRLLVDLGLRRAEVAGLAPGDIEYDAAGAACALHVVGKGYRQRLRIALPAETSGALARWLQLRGAEPGPLLRLTPRGIAKAVARIGGRAGVRATPHALRRVSITAALDATGGDVRRVRAHSEHANVGTVMRYDDARDEGSVSRLVAARL